MEIGILQRQAIDKDQQQCQTHIHHVTSLMTCEERREKVKKTRDWPATMAASNRTVLWTPQRKICPKYFIVTVS